MNYNRPTTGSSGPGGNSFQRPGTPAANARPGSMNNNPSANAMSRPGTSGNPGGAISRQSIYSDHQGNVYQRTPSQANTSNWQQRQNRAWSPVNNSRPEVQNLDRQQNNRNRGEMRAQNFQRISASPSSGGYRPSSGGGGARPSGGGGGASRSGGGGGGRGR